MSIYLKPLNPHYIAGFVDGEGCFSICISKHKTLRKRLDVRAVFEIEVRADDKEILERIKKQLNCGVMFNCNYKRYGWYPHVKYKISRLCDIKEKLIPFFEKYPLQAKKAKSLEIFKKAVDLQSKGLHLTPGGIKLLKQLQQKMRIIGKKHIWNR